MDEMLKTYGAGAVLLGIFLYWFKMVITANSKDAKRKNQLILDERKAQNEIMAREREELKARVFSLEKKVDADGLYIRDNLTKLLKENILAFATVSAHNVTVNASLIEANKSFKDLEKTVGKIKRVQVKEEE